MQAVVQHSLAHRAQPATRSLRWQPYGSYIPIPGATQMASGMHPTQLNLTRSPTTITYLPTPSSPVINQYDHALPASSSTLTSIKSHSSLTASKDSNCHKRHLADQAASSLCDIWRTQDIPSVFLVPPTSPSNSGTADQRHRSSLDASAFYPSPPSSNHGSSPTTSPPILCAQTSASNSMGAALTSTKSFVYEVLRRSKTSSSVLGTALCYLEAIRGHVSTLQQREKTTISHQHSNADQGSSIISFDDLDESEKRMIQELEAEEANECADYRGEGVATVRVIDDVNMPGPVGSFSIPIFAQPPPAVVCASIAPTSYSVPTVAADQSKSIIQTTPTNAVLPSPLLCPRRSFLAALILATKFSQDRCYSNKAWAKLSGLPPREIGRCERALGQALDWRLWVGKGDAPEAEGFSGERSGVKAPRCPNPCAVSIDGKALEMPVARRSAGLRKAQSQIFNFSPANQDVLRGLKRRHSPPAVQRRLYAASPYEYVPLRAPHIRTLASSDACSPMSSISTPNLSYSPSSTECSGGNDDIMSSILDPDSTFAPSNSKYFLQVPIEGQVLLDQDAGLLCGHEDVSAMYREVY